MALLSGVSPKLLGSEEKRESERLEGGREGAGNGNTHINPLLNQLQVASC